MGKSEYSFREHPVGRSDIILYTELTPSHISTLIGNQRVLMELGIILLPQSAFRIVLKPENIKSDVLAEALRNHRLPVLRIPDIRSVMRSFHLDKNPDEITLRIDGSDRMYFFHPFLQTISYAREGTLNSTLHRIIPGDPVVEPSIPGPFIHELVFPYEVFNGTVGRLIPDAFQAYRCRNRYYGSIGHDA